jgi:DNA invertase Pin-like site-specific DNA recombinase
MLTSGKPSFTSSPRWWRGDQLNRGPMSESRKVQSHHLQRDAYLYVRQSSMKQVLENVESTKRQYALRTRATALGWSEDRIVVIDSDQGESGASAAWRGGFRRLVTDVGLGRAGIVMGLEVSRLARNNADWHRLLEICALANTLILDEDGVYDPTDFNDRLLLGLKGTMSEAELHVLKARLRGGILNKVRRGEYRCVLPTGLVYDESGAVALDPDAQVRGTIAHFFDTFARVGSAHQAVKAFRMEGLRFPSRLRGPGSGVVFRPLTASAAMRTLRNPRYAGAYAYGQRAYARTVDGKKTQRRRASEDWLACIPNAHTGYISWDQYQQNLRLLASNGHGYDVARASPPREGAAILQGRAICGRCGQHMRVRYRDARGKLESWYICDRATDSRAEPSCQSLAGTPIDEAVGRLVAEKMTPAAVELALEVRREIEDRYDEADQLRSRAVERAQVDADLAQRRFMMVDPANRLVADTLESNWNEKLRALAKARDERERARSSDRIAIDEAIRDRLVTMTSDFSRLWSDRSTPNRERKRMLAYLLEDATLLKLPDTRTTKIHLRLRGGQTMTLTTANPKPSCEKVKTPSATVELVDRLLEEHTCADIAALLDARGLRPGGAAWPGRGGARFTTTHVQYLVHAYGLRPRFDRLRARGLLTMKELAARLGIHEATLASWVKHGIIKAHAYNGHAWLYEEPATHPAKHSSRWDLLRDRAAAHGASRSEEDPCLESKGV